MTTIKIRNPVLRICDLLPPTTAAKINEIATTEIIGKILVASRVTFLEASCKRNPMIIGNKTT